MRLSNTREFLWPLLEAGKSQVLRKIKAEDITLNDRDDLKTALELALRYYDGEEERKKAIESKSIIFIGTTGFIIAILLGITKEFLFGTGDKHSSIALLSLFIMVVVEIYFCRTVWFSLQALKRRSYHIIDHHDFTKFDNHYQKELIAKIVNITKQNLETVNSKVNSMVMAQEYFQRAIVLIATYSLLVLLMNLFHFEFNIANSFENALILLSNTNINTWILVGIFALLVLNLAGLLTMFIIVKAQKGETKASGIV